MQRMNYCVLVALVMMVISASRVSAANLLANPGFEDPVTAHAAPFTGSWNAFNGGAGASATNSTASPRSGAQNLDLSIVNSGNNFAGVFQDVPGLTPGTPVLFSIFTKSPAQPVFDIGAEMRIEWRNSVSDTEVTRTGNTTTAPGAAYAEIDLNSIVPAGADTARVVYAVQSFGGGASHTGTMYLDDASFTTVPEPASMAVLGLGGLALAGLRRRRA